MTPAGVNFPAFRRLVDATDPGGLSPLADLDRDHDGDLDHIDLAILERATDVGYDGDRQYSTFLDARWRLNQARLLVATGATALDATVRGALDFTRAPSGALGPRDAIQAVRSLHLAPLRTAGVPLVAAFDYDDTLAHGDVFLPAMRALAARRLFPESARPSLRAALVSAGVDPTRVDTGTTNEVAALLSRIVGASAPADMPNVRPVPIGDAFYLFGDAMRGMDVARARATMTEAFRSGIPSHGVPPLREELLDASPEPGDSARDIVDATTSAGLTPWIVTWGFDFIAQAAAPWAGVDPAHVVGHGMHQVDGKFAGLLRTSAQPKWEMIRDAIGTPPIVSFGNSGSDLPMIDATAGPSFLVNPTSQSMSDALAARADRTSPIWFTRPT